MIRFPITICLKSLLCVAVFQALNAICVWYVYFLLFRWVLLGCFVECGNGRQRVREKGREGEKGGERDIGKETKREWEKGCEETEEWKSGRVRGKSTRFPISQKKKRKYFRDVIHHTSISISPSSIFSCMSHCSNMQHRFSIYHTVRYELFFFVFPFLHPLPALWKQHVPKGTNVWQWNNHTCQHGKYIDIY